MVVTYLLIGTNSGDRHGNIIFAGEKLEKNAGRVINASCIYETEPWGFASENNFYNQALGVNTELDVAGLFNEILKIEMEAGRIRNNKRYADRPLDIDVLFFGSSIINSEKITIPHPRLHLRKFALAPLAEIAPLFLHPVFEITIEQMLDECKDECIVLRL